MSESCLYISEEESGKRADIVLTGRLGGLSRSYIHNCLKEGLVTLGGKAVKANYKVRSGDEICIVIPEKKEPSVEAEDIPLDIIYEDDDILVVNKPKDMVVHPAAGHYSGTLVNAVMYHCKGRLSGINGVLRPGIAHRIDKDTTGALVVCKSDVAHRGFAQQLAVHSIKRKYRAIVHGRLKEEEFTIETTIGRHQTDRKKMAANVKGGRQAVTDVKVLRELNGYSYIECTLHTGRTHQIRVHMSHIGHPVLGDEVYGPKKCPVKGLTGQTLHAYMIGFVHPVKNEYMEFYAPLPQYFEELLIKLA
jgi:23S rRNA pseudouridine1911/1915/1917 synthase